MSDPTGFLKFKREDPKRMAIKERIRNWNEFYEPMGESELHLRLRFMAATHGAIGNRGLSD